MTRIQGRMPFLAAVFATALAAMTLTVVTASPASGAAPAGYPITGIDVSSYQGAIDWAAVATGGAKFAYIRATEQLNPDSRFSANYQGAKANGLYAGAYHRARPDLGGGRAQADYFIDRANYVDDGKTLPPMLDIEWPRSTWTGLDACYNLTPKQISTWIRDFVNEVAVRTGRLAMIYTNPNWWGPCTADDATFRAYPLFNSGYTANPPPLPAGWTNWTLWQYSNSGTLPGDQDVFNGDAAALAALAGAQAAPPVIGLFSAANNNFVSAASGGDDPLIANRPRMRTWEMFDLIDAGGGFVALRSLANGMYVTAANGGNDPLIANRAEVKGWEKFTIVNQTDGSIALRANVNNKYVSAEDGGDSALIANRTAVSTWEKFARVKPPVPNAVLASASGKYVAAADGGNDPLIANRTAVDTWETFDLVDVGYGFVSFFAHANSMYVSAANGGNDPLIANRSISKRWEQFLVVDNGDGTVALKASANGKYVSAAGTSNPLIANATAIGPTEKFLLVN